MRVFGKVVVCLFLCFLFGCNSGPGDVVIDVGEGANPWTNLEFNNNPEHFQFAIVADRTGSNRAGIFADAVDKLNLLQPEFVMCVGDLIEGGIESDVEIDRQWDEFDGIVERLEMPFFYVPGNHDISNAVMLKKWGQRLGRPYYHFVYNNVLFLCLDTEDPPASATKKLSSLQLEYFAKALAENADVSWTLVFMHEPLWVKDYDGKAGWDDFEALLDGRQYSVFAGHYHCYEKSLHDGQRYYQLATTGGGSPLTWPLTGHFDQIMWVTMTEDGPRTACLVISGIVE